MVLAVTLCYCLVQADNLELTQLRNADQADRHFVSTWLEIDWQRIGKRDAARRNRVREILTADQVHTATDFDCAALIMQHGDRPSDFLLAHELASIAAYLGKFGSLPALTEDRWLNSLDRPQRWGSQFKIDGSSRPIDTLSPTVTDSMRRDLLLPTVEEIKLHGMKASMANIEEKINYIESRMDKSRWKDSVRLTGSSSIEQTLTAVNQGELNTANDYVRAAQALIKSKNPTVLLLAHELSLIAMARRSPDAPRLFAKSLDLYLAATGLPKRYSGAPLCPGVIRYLR